MIHDAINSFVWAHEVTTGQIFYSYTIEDLLTQLPKHFYGPIYYRHTWPTDWNIRYLNYNSVHVFEVL